jgi:AraC family transcriptional regulator, transcriptional activator of pobA
VTARRPVRPEPIATIAFDRRKYGPLLDADANEVQGLRDYIVAPRPHRLQFYELVLLRRAAGWLDVDRASVPLCAGRVVCTRPGEVRRWRLDGEPSGIVVCFEPALFGAFFADAGFVDRLPYFAVAPRRPWLDLTAASFAAAEVLATAVHGELQRHRPDTQHLLRARLYQLLIELARCAGAPAPAVHPSGLAQRFQALVEQRFRREVRVDAYARALGVTPGRLAASVRGTLGTAPGALIRARRLLEAERLLQFGGQSVVQVARELAFRDASYFVRFFKRAVGSTPQVYRRGMRSHHDPGEK